MLKDKYVFAQLVSFLDRNKYNRIVAKYQGDKYIKSFTCWNQLLVMMFGQLANRESLRDLIVATEAHCGKLYHLGMGKSVTRSNLAKANETRDYRIFEEFAFYMIEQTRSKRKTEIFNLGGSVYAFDSTTIDLCLSVFDWAGFRKHKGGIKMHTLYDIETQVPAFVHITNASVHDSKAMPEIPYEPGAHYIFDRGYNDYGNLYKIDLIGGFFVVRAKTNVRFKPRIWKRRLKNGIKSDATGSFTVYKSSKDYPEKLRKVICIDPEDGTRYINNLTASAETIAELYRNRWSVELFFKWIKQHLHIRTFYGTSKNAVYTQIWIAICDYLLLIIAKKRYGLDPSLHSISNSIGQVLFQRADIREIYNQPTTPVCVPEAGSVEQPTLW